MSAEGLESGTPLQAALPLASLGPGDLVGARATALVFRTLASPLRVRIVAYLCQRGPTSRARLTTAMHETWSMMEHHLLALVRDGFVTADGQGTTCVYALTDGLMPKIRELSSSSPSE